MFITTLTIFIVIFILIISLVIFAPKSKNFYNCKDTYPRLHVIASEANLKSIRKDIESIDEWINYYGMDLWCNDASEFKIFPVYMNKKYISKNADKCPNLLKQVQILPNVKNIFFGKFKAQSQLNEWREYNKMVNDTLRCVIGLKTKTFGNKRVNIWINGEIKNINTGTTLIMDHSKKNSIFNETKEDAVVLFIDIDRPKNIHKGEGADVKPSDYDRFLKMIDNCS